MRTDELSDGTGELKDQISEMDTEIENKIDDVISSMQGSDEETVSFVSEKCYFCRLYKKALTLCVKIYVSES